MSERADGGRRVFLLGLDGLPPKVLRRFVAEGFLPAFASLMSRAAVVDLVPPLPPLTAPGWLTIASGACPSTVGVESILLPTPGEAPDAIRNGFDADLSRAEYLWETVDRAGLEAIVVKYPGSWPPRSGRFVQVDGAGGYADITCRFEVAPSLAYVAGRADNVEEDRGATVFPTGYAERWRIDTGAPRGVVPVVARTPSGWRMPTRAEPVFECVVPLEQHDRRGRRILHALAYRRDDAEEVVLSPEKDASGHCVHLRAGSWSDWIFDDADDGHAYRFKLLSLDLAEKRFHLYRSASHSLRGFTRPARLADELLASVGPIVEWTGTYDLMNGLVDLETQLELYEQHTEWMVDAIRYLTTAKAWDAFFTHWHVIEYAHHLVGASLYPEHPLHRPELVERDLDFLRSTYRLADRLVAAAQAAAGDDALLAVAGDHGHDLVHSVFFANHFLVRHGWLALASDDGAPAQIDWSRTQAYALFPGSVFCNVAERWPGGIVRAECVDALVAEIRNALLELVDQRTDERPVARVFDRSELARHGAEGPRAPDLAFCLRRGYEVASRIEAGPKRGRLFAVTVPYREATSGHGSFLPTSPSARTLALLSGPGVRASRFRRAAVDLAPTLASFLGIDPPRDSEGTVIPCRAKSAGLRGAAEGVAAR